VGIGCGGELGARNSLVVLEAKAARAVDNGRVRPLVLVWLFPATSTAALRVLWLKFKAIPIVAF
jgi:hypothetical protein